MEFDSVVIYRMNMISCVIPLIWTSIHQDKTLRCAIWLVSLNVCWVITGVCGVITSSLWASTRYRSLRAAKPVSSTLKPVKPASSSLPSPEALPAGSELAAVELDPLLPAEGERTESRAWHSRDRWSSNRGRRRTAPGHGLHKHTK